MLYNAIRSPPLFKRLTWRICKLLVEKHVRIVTELRKTCNYPRTRLKHYDESRERIIVFDELRMLKYAHIRAKFPTNNTRKISDEQFHRNYKK